MTAYILTPEQHAQATDAIDNWIKQVVSGRGLAPAPAYEALAMLKAMKPVSPVGWWDTFDGGDFTYSISELCGGPTDGLHPLYTPTKD